MLYCMLYHAILYVISYYTVCYIMLYCMLYYTILYAISCYTVCYHTILYAISYYYCKLYHTILYTVILHYRAIVREMPPTPSKFHYIFNLRDLSRVYAGLCQTTPELYRHNFEFLRVWRNECLRVFHDRLINSADQNNIQVAI